MFLGKALENYKNAQQYYPTKRVQEKIKKIENALTAVKLVDDGFGKFDDITADAAEKLDKKACRIFPQAS
jgi:hypothetical protein